MKAHAKKKNFKKNVLYVSLTLKSSFLCMQIENFVTSGCQWSSQNVYKYIHAPIHNIKFTACAKRTKSLRTHKTNNQNENTEEK